MTDIALNAWNDAHFERKPSRALRALFACLRGIARGNLEIQFPNGEIAHYVGPENGPNAVFQIVSMRFAKRLSDGDIGFAEGYVAGEWNSPDLVALLDLILANRDLIDRYRAQPLVPAAAALAQPQFSERLQTKHSRAL